MNYKNKDEIQIAEELISPPGETLQETIEAKGISQIELAKRMNRPAKTINEIIKGKASITYETAYQLENVLGVSAEFWLEREKNYRLELGKIHQARQRLEEKEWLKNFPIREMKKMNWLNYSENNILEESKAVYRFFAVSSSHAYENYYSSKLQSAFRCTDKRYKNPYAVNAWLRKGELQASEIEASEFDAKKFRKVLNNIRNLIAEQPETFFKQLKELCLSAGVKIVYTPCLPGTKLHGSTSWYRGNPVIQLSNHYKRNDIFWLTFFHEAGHILLHGKKDVFVEGLDLEYTEEEARKEKEADNFAIDYTFPEKEENRLLVLINDSTDILRLVYEFAAEIKTHPAIIAGRLAKKGIIHDSFGWTHDIYQKVDLPFI